MVTSQEIVERSFYISLLHQTLIRGLTINPENYLVENEDGLWVPTRELNEQYIRDKEAIETELTKKGSGFYYIFGVGNNQSRGQKDLPRITLDLTAWYPGEIGIEKETYELDEASGLYQVIDYDYEPKSSRIDVHLCANNQQEMRILHEIMYKALPSRGYIKPYLNDYESWKNSKFSPSGNIYIEVGNFYDHNDLQQGFLEKVYTYEVRDGLLKPEILNETVTPIADISVLIDSALTLHVPEIYPPKPDLEVTYEHNILADHYLEFSGFTRRPDTSEIVTSLSGTVGTDITNIDLAQLWVCKYLLYTDTIRVMQGDRDVTSQCTYSIDNPKITFTLDGHTITFRNDDPYGPSGTHTPTTGTLTIILGQKITTVAISLESTNTTEVHPVVYAESEYYTVDRQAQTISLLQAGSTNIVLTGSTPKDITRDHYLETEWPKYIPLEIEEAPSTDLHLSMADFTWDGETNTYSYDIDEDTTIYVEYKTYNENIPLEKRVRVYNNIDYYGVQCKGNNPTSGVIVPRLYVSKGSLENIKDITINYAIYVSMYDKFAEISLDISNSGENELVSLNANTTTLLTYTYTRISSIPWEDYLYYPGDPPLRLISIPGPNYSYQWSILGISDIHITFN